MRFKHIAFFNSKNINNSTIKKTTTTKNVVSTSIKKQKPIGKTIGNSTIPAFMKNVKSYRYNYDKETF